MMLFYTLKQAGYSNSVAYLGGLALVLAPHASESSLGNSGPIGFPLLVPLIASAAMPAVIKARPFACAVMAVASAITTPFTFICAVIILTRTAVLRERLDRGTKMFVLSSSLSLWLNLIVIGPGRVLTGNGEKLFLPWNGMGLFWWTGLVGPVLISAGVLVVWLLSRSRGSRLSHGIALLAVSSTLLQMSLYWLGGIGDRYFVAPMTLSVLSFLLLIVEWGQILPKSRRLLITTVAVLGIVTPSVKWFSAGNFLSRGPTWSAEVRRAERECRYSTNEWILLRTGDAKISLPCSYILKSYSPF
jgi:hypothetical protein